MHRVAGLESNDLAPTELLETIANLGRAFPQVLEVVMRRRLDTCELATDVDRVGNVVEIVHGRVQLVGRTVDTFRFGGLVRRPDIADLERREDDSLEVPKCKLVTALDSLREFLGDVQRDRYRPEHTTRQAHTTHDRIVVGLVQKSVQRRKGAIEQQFDIAKLAFAKIP